MNRSLTALFAACEAALVVAIGIGITLAPLTILWGVQFGFATEWVVFWRASVDIWLIGHGVDVNMTLDPVLAASMGLPGAEAGFPLTIAVLGIALITVLLGLRAGGRIAESRHALLGAVVATAAFAALAGGLTFTALHANVRPSISQGIVLPTLVFSLGLVIGMLRADTAPHATGNPVPARLRARFTTWRDDLPATVVQSVGLALRAGAAMSAMVIAIAAVVLSALIAVNYAAIVALYEALHVDALGGAVITLAQIALLPNLVVWTAAWLVGPGFAIGVGSSVGPLGTQLGPIPALPVFGALPTGDLAIGFLGLLVPVVAAFLVAAVFGRRLDPAPAVVAGTAVGMGLVAGLVLGLLAWASAGSAGPGRLVQVGPDPLAVGVAVALEVAIAGGVGLVAATRTARARD